MEGVDHVDVVQVGCSCLVCDVHRMVQGKVPDGEGLEFGVSCLDATFMLVVELREAYRHLAAARPWSRYDYQGTSCLHVVVLSESFVRVNQGHVVGVALDGVMIIGTYAKTFQTVAIHVSAALPIVVSDDYAANQEATILELSTQAKHVLVVGDSQILAHLVLLDVEGTDYDDDLSRIAQLLQHAKLAVWLETWKNSAGMIVVEELSAQLHIQLSLELCDPFFDVF